MQKIEWINKNCLLKIMLQLKVLEINIISNSLMNLYYCFINKKNYLKPDLFKKQWVINFYDLHHPRYL